MPDLQSAAICSAASSGSAHAQMVELVPAAMLSLAMQPASSHWQADAACLGKQAAAERQADQASSRGISYR